MMASPGFNHCRGGQSRWYNRRTGRKGNLWEGRYTSVIVQSSEFSSCTVSAQASAVEEEERALRTMAAYIDLNPVRAGIVGDPAAYRWSGYAEAMAGKARSRRGLVRIIGQMAWPRGKGSGSRVQGSRKAPWTPSHGQWSCFRRWWSGGRWCFTGRIWEGKAPAADVRTHPGPPGLF